MSEVVEGTVTTVKQRNTLKWIGIGLVAVFLVAEGFGFYRGVINRAVDLEAVIGEQSKKEALYELSAIQSKIKVQGSVTQSFSKLESANVKTNMDSQRAVTMGVMSILGSDLRSVGMPTNGMMELKHSAEFYKELMANCGPQYDSLKRILIARAAKITEYEKFTKDPMYSWVLRTAGYPSLNLKTEKAWTIVSSYTKNANETGVAEPVNPLGKNAEISE